MLQFRYLQDQHGRSAHTRTFLCSEASWYLCVQALLPAQVMVAGRRLEALLEQAIDAQLRRCMFHNNHRVAVSLLTDYVAGAEQIPTRTVQARHADSHECAHRTQQLWQGLN